MRFGFMILMGINHLPALPDYWKLDPTYRRRPIVDKITRDHFVEITCYFHFVATLLYQLLRYFFDNLVCMYVYTIMHTPCTHMYMHVHTHTQKNQMKY